MVDQPNTSNTLVIIDDNQTDIDIYLRYLRIEKHDFTSIVCFKQPDEAADYLRKSPPTCCLLDHHYPTGDSIELIAQLKSPDLEFPLVVSTGRGDEELAVELLHMGVQDYLVKDKLTSSMLIRTLKHAVKTFALEKELRHMAHFDTLTGLLNRHLFMDRLKQATQEARRYKRELIVLYIDIDHFKQINDTHGHDIGDEILVTVASRLKACLRESDSAARLGGDEFAVLLPDTNTIQGHVVAQKLLESIPVPIKLENSVLTIFPSIGLASFPESTKNHVELLKQADVALYKAKELGRAQYVKFSQEHSKQWNRKKMLLQALPDAIANNRIEVNYQPAYNLNSGECHYVEALVSWELDGEKISGQEIINLVQECSLGLPFYKWMFDLTLRQLKQWRKQHPELILSLNIPTRLFHSEAILDSLACALTRLHIPPKAIMFEVSEVNLMQQASTLKDLMLRLTNQGFGLAITQFGIGDSSVELLVQMQCKLVKIDPQFTQSWGEKPGNKLICTALLSLAHHLKLESAASNIDNMKEAHDLKALGFMYGQGRWFGGASASQPNWQTFIEETLKARKSSS